jgi:hypothetical protein
MTNSGLSLQTMGLGCLRFMLRGGSLPRVSRSIAPSVIAPPSGRRTLFKTRRLSVAMATLRHVTIGNPGGAGDDCTGAHVVPQFSLSRKLPGNPAQDSPQLFKSLLRCGLRHAQHLRSPDVPKPRIYFPIDEKNDERRR